MAEQHQPSYSVKSPNDDLVAANETWVIEIKFALQRLKRLDEPSISPSRSTNMWFASVRRQPIGFFRWQKSYRNG